MREGRGHKAVDMRGTMEIYEQKGEGWKTFHGDGIGQDTAQE
jgi:hypothetical protein